jgi:hypothetical protein
MIPFYPAFSSILSPGQKDAESKQAIFDPAPMVLVSVFTPRDSTTGTAGFSEKDANTDETRINFSEARVPTVAIISFASSGRILFYSAESNPSRVSASLQRN